MADNEIVAAILTGPIGARPSEADHTISQVARHLWTYRLILEELNKIDKHSENDLAEELAKEPKVPDF
jgi:hypothetical protein